MIKSASDVMQDAFCCSEVNVCGSIHELADLMNCKGDIRPGKSQVMQRTNKAMIGMNINYGFATCCRESDIWYTRSFAGTAMNHVMLGEEICRILGLSDNEAFGRSLDL